VPYRPRDRFPRSMTVAERKARAEAAAVRLGVKGAGKGGEAQPIRVEGRTITRTFWGNAWCENLQSYADLAYRLDRGRSYLRSGAVIDLRMDGAEVKARVVGTRIYKVRVALAPIAPARWKKIVRACTGRIGSLVALLRGELPDEVMEVVTARGTGLFPEPAELEMSCDCPDSAALCKHLAATLYGVGVRLDDQPQLLFQLRGVQASDLIEQATAGLAASPRKGTATLKGSTSDLAELFGIELVDAPPEKKKAAGQKGRRRRRV
jgi:uncharacterized Zn finger protein